mmetsp:Transcript_18501/g.34015  ORF Transcript_18501/g.34015 Transcript_18501/m.34015 type:complete len:317 (+) Transcript_18501:61-1011(+)
MKAFYTMTVLAAQATVFSTAKVPATNFLSSFSSSIPHITVRPIAIHSMKATPILSKTSLTLSSASMGGFLLRGGAAADAVVLQNFYGDALGFFDGIRTPATFLAGSSLAAIFTLKSAASNQSSDIYDSKLSTLERRVIKFYHLVSLLAFILSLNTIVIATSAHTSVLHGRFDQMAETAYMLMKREFEYEFVSVRWSFLISMFCFLGMVTSRVLIEFGLLKCDGDESSRKDVAMLIMCSVGALAANLLSYVNSTLSCWHSLFEMTMYLAQLGMKRAFVEMRLLKVVSVLCTLASVFLVGKLALKDLKEGSTKDKKIL